MFNGFGSLNLSGVEAESARPRTLKEGAHVCKIVEVALEQTRNKQGWKLLVKLEALDGSGYVQEYINIDNPNPQATEIGQKRLKHLLIEARHPNPDRPQDVKTLLNLVVGVHVVQGEKWQNEKGEWVDGGGEPRKYAPYFAVEGQAEATQQTPSLDDEIPF